MSIRMNIGNRHTDNIKLVACQTHLSFLKELIWEGLYLYYSSCHFLKKRSKYLKDRLIISSRTGDISNALTLLKITVPESM